jgi:hypothetical protein
VTIMSTTRTTSRRQFLQSTAAAVAAPCIVPATVLGRGGVPPPSDRINLGIIGVNSMGRSNLAKCARHGDVEVTAICDAWDKRVKDAVAAYPSARGYRD